MTGRIALLTAALLATACDPAWTLNVEVRSPSSVPIEGAAVGFVCHGSMDRQSQAAHSGVGGHARIGSIGYFPRGCDISVAAPGYDTLVIRYDDMCPDGKNCSYGTDVAATLEPKEGSGWHTARRTAR